MRDDIVVKVSVAGPSLLADHIAAVPVRKRAARLATLAAIGLAIETGKGGPSKDVAAPAPVPATPPVEPAAGFDPSMLDALIGLGIGAGLK